MPIVECIPYRVIKPIEDALAHAFPAPHKFQSREEIENLTHEQALNVLRATRRQLVMSLIAQEYHEHMLDDCGDYLTAATDNWNTIYHHYWDNDGDEGAFARKVSNWLLDTNQEGLGGSDGEIRFDLLTENLLEDLYGA